MKTKSFQKYLEKRLNKEEIAEIEAQAQLEVKTLRYIQKSISAAMDDYVKKNKIGFNDLVRKLDWSPSKVSKIQKGEANLTLASIAHLCATLEKEPQEIFRNKK